MRPIHLILVALRNLGSECHRTVANAARLARALGADLELFHAIDVPRYVDTVTGGESWLERAQADSQARCSRKLERIAARLRECGLQVGTTVEWDHPAHEAIIRHGERVGAELIVAERSGAHHVAPALLHPTEWELLRLSPVPLLLASAGTPAYRRPVMVAAVDPARAHSKPAALDEEILQAAGTLNRALGARLHVVHAYGLVSMGMPLEMQAAPYVIADAETVTAAEAQEGLDRLLSSCGISVTRSHVVGTSAKDAIRDLVRSTHSSIIVMGAVPRRGIAGLLLGNTAERVLAALNCDVLIVKPPEFRSQVQRAPRAARSIPAPAFP
jgi:universal stress protein E